MDWPAALIAAVALPAAAAAIGLAWRAHAGVPRSNEVRDRLDELTGRSRVPS